MQDIIDAVDDRQIVGLPGFAAVLYLHPADEDLKLEVLRGRQKISVLVPAIQRKDERYDLADFIDPRNVIDGLGVFMNCEVSRLEHLHIGLAPGGRRLPNKPADG